MLKEQNVIPLYQQLIAQLESEIIGGKYKAGEKLLSENEMAMEYGVSVITVRKALSEMVDRGLIERHRGKGTFVSQRKYQKNITRILSFSDMCKLSGAKPGGIMLENKLVDISDEMKEMYGFQENKAVYIKRVRTADDSPVVVEENFFPISYAALLTQTFNDESLYKYLLEKFDTTLTVAKRTIAIKRASKEEAELLQIKKNEPLLQMASVVYAQDGTLCYFGKQSINGERFVIYA